MLALFGRTRIVLMILVMFIAPTLFLSACGNSSTQQSELKTRLVGRWETRTANPVIFEFQEDGTFLTSGNGSPVSGTYDAKDPDRLEITIEDQASNSSYTTTYIATFVQDNMILRKEGNDDIRLVKVG